MTNGSEMTPPPGFSTPPQIPNNTTSKRPPVITTVFFATTPENMAFAYRTSTLDNPNPMISPAFVEANYEVLGSLLREQRRQICNEDLRTELEYFSKDYDEERERWNQDLNPTGKLLQPFGQGLLWSTGSEKELWDLMKHETGKEAREEEMLKIGNPSAEGIYTYHPQGGIYHRLSPTMAYLHTIGSFADSTSSVTPFVRLIEDYPLPDGLKMPSHIGSYDGKGDPDNFLHLFEGAIRMQKYQKTGSILNYEDLKAKFRSHFSQQKKFTKTHLVVYNIKQREGESTKAFVTRYTNDTLQILGLHKERLISGFLHGLRTRSLVEHLSTDLLYTYKGLMEKTYTWIEARKVATNGTPNDRRENFERSRKSSWDNNRGQKGRDREILATEKAAKSFKQPPRMFGSRRSRDMSKYCHFYEDYGHDTNDCRQLRNQIEEAVKSG
ncbi:hypothetical protein Tco_1296784 [Tanacetum coccineum]